MPRPPGRWIGRRGPRRPRPAGVPGGARRPQRRSRVAEVPPPALHGRPPRGRRNHQGRCRRGPFFVGRRSPCTNVLAGALVCGVGQRGGGCLGRTPGTEGARLTPPAGLILFAFSAGVRHEQPAIQLSAARPSARKSVWEGDCAAGGGGRTARRSCRTTPCGGCPRAATTYSDGCRRMRSLFVVCNHLN